MTMKKSPIEPEMRDRAGWSKRVHAWVMAKGSPKIDKFYADYKQALFASLQGDVLEIGPGTGPNLPYYPVGIRWIGIEPNPYMHPYLRKEAERLGLHVDLRRGNAENLETDDKSVDAVVGTLILCTVPDVSRTLQEVLRVLKPGGRFVFVEHVAAPRGSWRRRVQQLARPVWKALADGCHPDRETWLALENAGFESVSLQHFLIPFPMAFPIVGPHIAGVATKKSR